MERLAMKKCLQVLDGLVLLAALILNPLAARRRRRAQAELGGSNGQIAVHAPVAEEPKSQPNDPSPHAAGEEKSTIGGVAIA